MYVLKKERRNQGIISSCLVVFVPQGTAPFGVTRHHAEGAFEYPTIGANCGVRPEEKTDHHISDVGH